MSEKNNNTTLTAMIANRAETVTDPAQRSLRGIHESGAQEICRQSGKNLREIYAAALQSDIWPVRYLRNTSILSAREQLKLTQSGVAIIGAGGLGGQVITILARMGIGMLTVADPDVFEASNLNRQALATAETLGTNKAAAAKNMLAAVNPAVTVRSFPHRLDKDNAAEILAGTNTVVDALDNVSDRLVLAQASKTAGIPLVHAAIAGFEGQIMTIYPQDPGLERIYGEAEQAFEPADSPEAVMGVPGVTPAVLASLQAMETVKILTNRGRSLRNRMLYVDLENAAFQEFSFGTDPDQA
ncbi:MAG: HesA/MoeB/ThiF family protein [Desulfobacterales bacterium]|nr:HesA/MoeB/ThiF family protein [Desulfobacterales bacterium]